MFTESAALYDLVYSGVKDYRAEAERLTAVIRGLSPGARTILDVACGTGSHAVAMAGGFGFEVDGLDLNPQLVEIARSKHPAGLFVEADMTSFRLDRSYDVVMCLFSSIAYARSADGVTAALTCMRSHLRPGGLVLVEPWLEPSQWTVGRVNVNSAETADAKVIRMSHSGMRGRVSVLTFDYLVGTERGVEHAHEIHELGLFTRSEMVDCFRRAGLAAEFDPVGPIGRGLYVAREA